MRPKYSYDDVSVGQRFNRWVVIEPKYLKQGAGYRSSTFTCQCDCGTVREVRGYHLIRGLTRGCSSCATKGVQAEKRAWFDAEKNNPCVDCGRRFPYYCMEFDHVPERGEKFFEVNLGTIMKKWTLEQLKAERAKCDLVCANCHNHRTWERDNGIPHIPMIVKFLPMSDDMRDVLEQHGLVHYGGL